MDGSKHPLKSLGIMGPAASLVVLAVNWKWPGMGLTETDVTAVIDQGATLFGFVTGLYGRWRARSQISIKPKE